MENASRVILIAGGILIAISIFAILMYSITQIEPTAEPFIQYKKENEITVYNSVYKSFEGRNDITAQEIVSVIYNSKNNEGYTRVFIGNMDVTESDDDWIRDFLESNIYKYKVEKDNKNADNSFSCAYNSIKYNQIGKIIEIKFIKN